jgi:DNA-binding NtrC family response regulator
VETILVVEDKESMAQMLKDTLESEGYEVISAKTGTEGLKCLRESGIDLILTDLKLPEKDGIEILRTSKEDAFDFITKPFDIDHLLMLIKRALETQRVFTENILLKEEFASKLGLPKIVGKSAGITEVAQLVQKVAPTKTTVLLLGESGTGKELFARAVHNLSHRRDYPFVPINCAAIPKNLLESELFGHEKGSFTGADAKKLGKFELADRGTIFLDEVGDMDLALQSKLLRAIQESEIERIGGVKTVKVDVRIVAASNRDLEKAVEDKSFREDLYYRLNVFPIQIPPLRERREDIPLLVEYFISRYCLELKTTQKDISKDALNILMNYRWKGNVRELENTLERAIILCDGDIITPEHIVLAQRPVPDSSEQWQLEGPLEDVAKRALRIVETRRIVEALRKTKGNKTKAAEILRVSYKTLLTKIKEYGIES